MPELPEVETIRLGLQSRIIGQTITNITILNPKSFIGDPEEVKIQRVLSIDRKAKVLIINLGRMSLLFHLKMSGQIIYRGYEDFGGGHPTKDMTSDMPNKSTRVIFELEDGSKIFFNDQRKFGWVKILPTAEVGEFSFIKKLGPEPLEKGFSWQTLKKNLLRHKTLAIKVAILDQTTVAGVGNIYACEACFDAKLDPHKKVGDLTDDDFKKIHKAIIKVLSLGIKHGGSSKTHYVNVAGGRGYFLDYAYVYSRAGQKCRNCDSQIKRVSLGGRGTFYCENCQN